MSDYELTSKLLTTKKSLEQAKSTLAFKKPALKNILFFEVFFFFRIVQI